MARIKVAVSPFYGGEDWTDAGTSITFHKSEHGLSVYSIPEEADLSGIRKAIRLNTLMLIEGTIPEDVVKEPVPEPAPAVEVKEEVKEEAVEEAPKETTKTKNKKASKK